MDEAAPYKTLAGVGEAQTLVERSRFLAAARPVSSLEEVTREVAKLRREHYDARHVCYGVRLGRGPQLIDRSNDDGEPGRTGGYPLWQLLDGEEITDALITVVRYFGGIKLGMGGLARAYRGCGRLALSDAGVCVVHPETSFTLTLPYAQVAKLEHTLGQLDTVRISAKVFAAEVTLTLAVHRAALGSVRELLAGLLQVDPRTIGPHDT